MLPKAPRTFNGKLSELFEEHIAPLLPSSDRVHRLHAMLTRYMRERCSFFAVRNRRASERGNTIRTECGDQIIFTDNSPAWAIHSILLSGNDLDDPTAFVRWLNLEMPIEFNMAHARKLDLINKARYHVAHLFDVQAGRDNSHPERWSQREVEVRFLRNLHPCNAFYIPIPKWHSYGADPAVKAFFHRQYSNRYKQCWADFVAGVGGEELSHDDSDPFYTYSESDWPGTRKDKVTAVERDIRIAQLEAEIARLSELLKNK
jgi:hypothetical protein